MSPPQKKKNISTEKSLIFVSPKDHSFLINFVSERSLLFKCLIHMHVTLYKSCAPGYLRPVSLLSPSNVCLSHWGLALTEDLILYWKSRNFYHLLSPKDPLFCVLEPF